MTVYLGLIFGPNGAGKGTLADGIVDKLGSDVCLHINSGQVIKNWAEAKHEISVRESADKGILVDDTYVWLSMHEFLGSIDLKSLKLLVIEGFPRKLSQLRILRKLTKVYSLELSWIINLYLPLQEVQKRLENRLCTSDGKTYNLIYNPPPNYLSREVSKRLDDKPGIVEERFNLFVLHTMECLAYKDFLDIPFKSIDSRKSIEQILEESIKFIEEV